jgi:hypothetical protein
VVVEPEGSTSLYQNLLLIYGSQQFLSVFSASNLSNLHLHMVLSRECLLFVLPFGTVQPEILKASLNKQRLPRLPMLQKSGCHLILRQLTLMLVTK